MIRANKTDTTSISIQEKSGHVLYNENIGHTKYDKKTSDQIITPSLHLRAILFQSIIKYDHRIYVLSMRSTREGAKG